MILRVQDEDEEMVAIRAGTIALRQLGWNGACRVLNYLVHRFMGHEYYITRNK